MYVHTLSLLTKGCVMTMRLVYRTLLEPTHISYMLSEITGLTLFLLIA